MNEIKYVSRDTDRHGNVRWYYRRNGSKVRLPGDPNLPKFRAAYQAASIGAPIRVRHKRKAEIARSYVYFLRVGDRVKIGFSTRPLSRIDTLVTAVPDQVDAFVFIRGNERTERALHAEFAEHHTSGEWFRFNPALARLMAQAAAYGTIVDRTLVPPMSHPEKSLTTSMR